eukprot:TRINITY_DN1886_c0_g1_i2.p1 TRINITY_DN1886_c0_g1~~TRINITY_DN1886_c0_g1_i2.p1  ORF type:complete len:118 (+),score=2.35 TRINITY_DN1886_c0_g1_i2:46-399(+)
MLHRLCRPPSIHLSFNLASLSPETTAMLMWVMSDRTLTRQFSTMEGFGVHTFKLVNQNQQAVLVKFHFKPLLGVHSTLWGFVHTARRSYRLNDVMKVSETFDCRQGQLWRFRVIKEI